MRPCRACRTGSRASGASARRSRLRWRARGTRWTGTRGRPRRRGRTARRRTSGRRRGRRRSVRIACSSSPLSPCECTSGRRRCSSGVRLDRPDEQIEDANLADVVAPLRERAPDGPQCLPVSVEIALVAAHERERALAERRTGAEVVVLQVALDDAVEHGDEGGPLRMQRLRRLREADAAQTGERVEELSQRQPRHRAGCERRLRRDRPEGLFDGAPPLEAPRDLGRGDPGPAAVRDAEVRLGEGRRAVAGLEAPGLEIAGHDRLGVDDLDAVSQHERHLPVSLRPICYTEPNGSVSTLRRPCLRGARRSDPPGRARTARRRQRDDQRARRAVWHVADGHEEAHQAARGGGARHDGEDRPGPEMHARALRLRGHQHVVVAARPLCAGRRTHERRAMSTTAKKGANEGFSAEEKAAMKARAKELKSKEDGETAVRDAIAGMAPKDRAIAKKIHELVKAAAPELVPKTWYGMPAYARDGKVVCYFRDAGKFKERYAMLGF